MVDLGNSGREVGEKDKEGKEGNKVCYLASNKGGLSPAGETLGVHREHTPQNYPSRGVKEGVFIHQFPSIMGGGLSHTVAKWNPVPRGHPQAKPGRHW